MERKIGEIIHGRLVKKVKGSWCLSCCFYSKGMCELTMEEAVAHDCGMGAIFVEIKQKQEDMEEKNLNLKPFDLEAAKAGKPVCTRDGRKARIICFDAKDTQPIIGLYEEDIDGIAREYLCSYHMDGRMYDDRDCGYDLMMLSEKKEGWVNVYYDKIDGITFSKHPHTSKEEAIKEAGGALSGRIDTVKISWEE